MSELTGQFINVMRHIKSTASKSLQNGTFGSSNNKHSLRNMQNVINNEV